MAQAPRVESAYPSRGRSDQENLRDMEAMLRTRLNALAWSRQSCHTSLPHRHFLQFETHDEHPRSPGVNVCNALEKLQWVTKSTKNKHNISALGLPSHRFNKEQARILP